MSQAVNGKSPNMEKMERLEEAVYKSWIRDMDKVEEMKEVHIFLTEILSKETIEDYFQSSDDFNYFITTFSNKVIGNILLQATVFGENGEEVAFQILKDYVSLFCKHMKRPNYDKLWESVKEIFDPSKQFYASKKNERSLKNTSIDEFNAKFLKKKTSFEVKPEMEIDVYVNSNERYSPNVWVRGIVCNTFDDGFSVRIGADRAPIILKYDSFDYSAKGTMTDNWEWRESLQIGDRLDCYERQRYFPGTVINRTEETFRGLKRIDYRISFRVYTEQVEDINKFAKFWPRNGLLKDDKDKIYLGDPSSYDETIPMYSKRLFPKDTKIWNGVPREGLTERSIDDMIADVDKEGKKTITVARTNNYSYYYILMINHFGHSNGFENLLYILENTNKEEIKKLSPDLLYFVFLVFEIAGKMLYYPFATELAVRLEKCIFTYIENIDNAELRNIKKESIDIISEVLKTYLSFIYHDSEKESDIIDKFALSFAIRMLKTTFLDKRNGGIKKITDYIRTCRFDKEKEEKLLQIIVDNKVLYEIFGPNSHVQLISKSKELLEVLLENDKLTDEDLNLIWNATKSGDLEAKLTILKILKEICSSIKSQYVHKLIENMLGDSTTELIDEEIKLIFELSLNQKDDAILEKCINFFMGYLLQSGTDEGEKIDMLIEKIYIIAKKASTYKINIVNKTLEYIKTNVNSSIGFKLLSVFFAHGDIDTDFDLEKLLIEDKALYKIYKESFKSYISFVKEKFEIFSKENANSPISNDVDKVVLNDKFSHSQNIKSRLTFLNVLLDNKLWDYDDCDPIIFVYTILVENKISIKDEMQFYSWAKASITKTEFNETEKKIFDLFTNKICINEESIQTLSSEGFDTFLKVFIDYNIKNNLLYINMETMKTTCFVVPDQLKGFDTLWKIIFQSKSPLIMSNGIELLHSLFTFCLINGEHIDNTSLLIKLCIDEIKKKSGIIKSVKLLKKIIEESEKHGTADVISHIALLRRYTVTIKVTALLGFNNPNQNFELKLPSNTTIYSLKKSISSLVDYHFDFIKFEVKNGNEMTEIKINDNGKTLYTMNFPSYIEMTLTPNGLEKTIPCKEICVDHEPTEEVVKVFNQWFDMFSINNQMNLEKCAAMVKAVTNSRADVSVDDSRVVELFNQRDHNRDGLIEREDFVSFYTEATVSKPKLVYENLRAMNVRNDLKMMKDPYYDENANKEVMPRYTLGHNDEYFNVLFDMISKENDDTVNKEIFDFVSMLSTNENVVKRGDVSEGKWKEVFHEENVYKMIYALEVIESIVENVSYSEKEDDAEWVKDFVNKKGYKYLIDLFIGKLSDVDSDKEKSRTSMICFGYLIKIVKIFYIAANDNSDDSDDINVRLGMFLKKEKLNEMILSSFTDGNLIQSLMNIMLNCKKAKNNEIMNEVFELISILLPNLEIKDNEEIEKNLIDIIKYGIICNEESTRVSFANAIMRMSSILQKQNKFTLIEKLFISIIDIVTHLSSEEDNKESSLFDVFAFLLDIFISNGAQFPNTKFDYKEYINVIVNSLDHELNADDNASPSLSDSKFIGYLKIISKITANNTSMKDFVSTKTNLIKGLLTKILFKTSSEDLSSKLNADFIDIDKFKMNNSREQNENIRIVCYDLILSMLKNSLSSFEQFFTLNVMSSKENSSEDNDKRETRISNERKVEGHVGLKNLGCICYMNSTMQQFFMVPSLRYSVLRFSDGVAPNRDPMHNNVDDNMFHQLQRMFSYLELSERVDYNPFGFTFSFKDFDGMPTKLSEQKDAQEFLSFFLDRLENASKPSMYKYMTQNIYGGKNCSQITCLSCGKVSNRYEDTLFLSVEVKNMKTLNDSLDKLACEEKIDGYQCEGCKQKVTISKRNIIASLPNVLIVHLQRICYNFEFDHNEKINSRLVFPRRLNMKQYTIEDISNKNGAQNETDEIYYKCDDYYDYYLVGVIVHVGSADSGHYYSYINTVRDGNGNIARYDIKNEKMTKSWLEFNDSSISKFNVENLEEECFGGVSNEKERGGMMFSWGRGEKCKNAYMLVYERKIKKPMKIVITDKTSVQDNPNVISYKQEERAAIMKKYDLTRYYGTNEYEEKCNELYQSVFYDVEKDEYYKYVPFYYNNRMIPKEYYIEIERDNSEFEKMKNISDEHFTVFFNKMISLLEEAILNSKDANEETAGKIINNFISFTLSMLCKKEKIEFLSSALDKLFNIAQSQVNFEQAIWRYFDKNSETIISLLTHKESKIVSSISTLLFNLISHILKSNHDEFTSVLLSKSLLLSNSQSPSISHCISLLKKITSLFPKLPEKSSTNISPVLKMLHNLCSLDINFVYYFGNREFIADFITYLLGRDSPVYSKRCPPSAVTSSYFDFFNNNSVKGSKHIIEIAYMIYEHSSDVTKNKDDINLSDDDRKCITSPNYLKFLFKRGDNFLSKFFVLLSKNNRDFTVLACKEIIDAVDEFNVLYQKSEFIQLLKSIIPLLAIKDDYQQLRFEYLFGIPTYLSSLKYNTTFPLMGYHLMKNELDKIVLPKSSLPSKGSTSILDKLYALSARDAIEFLTVIFDACKTNDELYKYIYSLPFESPVYKNVFYYALDTMTEKSDEYVEQEIKELSELIAAKEEIVKDIKTFNGDFIMKDIKRIEFKMIHSDEDSGVYVMQCEYFANSLPLKGTIRKGIDISGSKNKEIFSFNNVEEEGNVVEEENVHLTPEEEKTTVVLESNKISAPIVAEYMKNIVNILLNKNNAILPADSAVITETPPMIRKVIVENKFTVPNAKSVYKELIAFNLIGHEQRVRMKITRKEGVVDINEFIPVSDIAIAIPPNSKKKFAMFMKIDPEKNWSFDEEDIAIGVSDSKSL